MQSDNIIVVMVSDTLLTYTDGSMNPDAFERITLLLSDIHNSGINVCLVSAGAIVLGTKLLNIKERPSSLSEKQAIAAVGQVEMMKVYQDFFSEYSQTVAQVLLTRSSMDNIEVEKNVTATLQELFNMNIIPVVNENDSVSTDDIELEDNYPLVSNIANIINANAVVIASDIKDRYYIVNKGDNNAITADGAESVKELIIKCVHESTNEESSCFPKFIHDIGLNKL